MGEAESCVLSKEAGGGFSLRFRSLAEEPSPIPEWERQQVAEAVAQRASDSMFCFGDKAAKTELEQQQYDQCRTR
jgi:hypothetical protein